MPRLPQFTAEAGSLPISGGRRASGEDFGAAVGEALQSVSAAGRQIVTDIEESETRKVIVAQNEIRAKYAKRLDEAAISGADLGKIKEEMNNELSRMGDGLQTRKGGDQLRVATANTNLMYDQQANAIAVHRAGADAKLQSGKFLKDAGALVQTNPLYLKEAEANASAFADTLTRVSPEARAAIADGLKKDLNVAAARAGARDDPAGTLKKLEAGGYDLMPEQRDAALTYTKTEIRAARVQDEYERAALERVRSEANDDARDVHFKSIIGGTATRRAIMDDPALKPATREHLITFMESRATELQGVEKRSDQTTLRDLWMRINTSEGDPRKIYTDTDIFDAVKSGKINTTDADKLNAQLAQQKDENGRTVGSKLSGQMSIVGRALSQDPRYLARPEVVAAIQMDYQARVIDKVSEMRAAKKNPNDIFNPQSPDFVGSAEFIKGSVDNVTARANAAIQDQLPRPKTKAERDALPPDTEYISPDGKKARTAAAVQKGGPTASGAIREAQ
jgi:hypothetical protein